MLFTFLNITDFSLPFKSPVLIFSTILFIILFAPIVLNRFRIPHLIGLLIAGAIIGPNGFFLVERNSAFTLFGQVGLLYIMFLAGLEIDLAEFKKNSAKSIIFGLYTFLIPMGLGFLAGRYLLEFSVPSSLLLASIFASHTLIAYPIISKLGVSKNRAVHIAIGGTLITDTLALLVLAGVVGMYSDGVKDHFWLQLGLSLLAMGAFIMWGFPVIGRWFFKRFDDNVSQYTFILGMVFLGAFLAELAGVDSIIGAFLSGLALNKLVPQSSPLMNRIEFVGSALFIPFFLMGVGMLIDYRVFFKDIETIKVALVITIVAIVAKYIAAWLAQKSFGFSADERRLIFGLSNARVAAALAVALVGFNTIIGTNDAGAPVHLLDESVLNGSIVLIMVTCTVASFVAQKGARNIALMDNTNDIADDGDLDERILVAINLPERVNPIMELCVTIKSKTNKSGVYALNIINTDNPKPQDEKNAEKILKMAGDAAAGADTFVHQLKRYDLNLVNGITSVIKEHSITDLVMGYPDYLDTSDTFVGDLLGGVLAKCNANMLIYKPMQPLATNKRHLVVVPEKAELEIGFPFWLVKLWNVSRNTGSKLIVYASETTMSVMKKIADKHPVNIEFKSFTDWDDFLIIGRDLRDNDNLFIVMSRKGHPSYTSGMARIPSYLNLYFKENSFLLIYPMQSGIQEGDSGDLKNPSVLEPFQENLGRLDDLVKTISKLFRKR